VSTVQPRTGQPRYKPYSAYKDSGAEWLGEVPAHWEVQRRRFTAQIEAGQPPPSELLITESEGRPPSCEAAPHLSEAPTELDMLDGPDSVAEGEEELPHEPETVAEEAKS